MSSGRTAIQPIGGNIPHPAPQPVLGGANAPVVNPPVVNPPPAQPQAGVARPQPANPAAKLGAISTASIILRCMNCWMP